MKKLLTILLLVTLTGCSTTNSFTSNANVAPVIQSAVQAAATYAVAKDPAIKPDFQTILNTLQGLQISGIVITPSVVEQAVNKAFSTFGSSAAHILYIDNLISPYLTDIATDLPFVVAGLNAALNPPVATPTPAPAATVTPPAAPAPVVAPAPVPSASVLPISGNDFAMGASGPSLDINSLK